MFGISPTVLPTALGSLVFRMLKRERNSFTTCSSQFGSGLLASRNLWTFLASRSAYSPVILASPEHPGEGHYDTAASTSTRHLRTLLQCDDEAGFRELEILQ